MASLTRYSKGYKIRYRVYYPDGTGSRRLRLSPRQA